MDARKRNNAIGDVEKLTNAFIKRGDPQLVKLAGIVEDLLRAQQVDPDEDALSQVLEDESRYGFGD